MLNGGSLILLRSAIPTADQHYSPSSGPWLSVRHEVGKATVAMVMRNVKVAAEKRCDKRQGQI